MVDKASVCKLLITTNAQIKYGNLNTYFWFKILFNDERKNSNTVGSLRVLIEEWLKNFFSFLNVKFFKYENVGFICFVIF